MQQAENFHGEMSRDKPRHKAMVKMVVRSRCSNLPLFGNVAPLGESEITVYVDDVDKVKAQIETDTDALRAAEKEFIREIADEVKRGLDGADFQGTTADMVKLLAKPDKLSEVIAARYKYVLTTSSKSVPATFERINGRSLLPLDAAETVPGSEHPEYARRVQLEEADVVRKMLDMARYGTAPAAPAITAEQIAEMVQKGVREELARMASKGKPKAGDEA